MPRMPFAPENKAEVVGSFPKLKLDMDERALIVCIEDPVYAYVHTLRAPKIVNGKPEYNTVKRKDGTTFEAISLDFIGRPLCHGDLGILETDGVDPKNCPTCAMAKEGDQVEAPQRRFAMHVIQYSIKPGSDFVLTTPYSVQSVVWSFTDTIYNKLTDFLSEWGPLSKHDLKLGPCTNKDFQKFDIGLSSKAAWLEDDARKTLTVETFKENQTPDLESYCGRTVTRAWMAEDLEKIRARWRIANGLSATSDAVGNAERQSLTEGLGSLLDGISSSSPSTAEATLPATAPLSADAAIEAAPVTAAKEEAVTEPAPAAKKAAPTGDALSFDDLLSQLG